MTGNTLSTQMRRFRKLNARRQIDTPPAPAVRPSAHSSLRPGAGDYFKQADRGEQGRGGRARDERGEKIDPCRRPRSYPRCRSVSSSFHPVSVVVSSVIPSRRGSSRRFIRHPQRVPFPFARRYSFRRLIRRIPHRAPFPLARRSSSRSPYRFPSSSFSSPFPVSFPRSVLRPVSRFVPRPSARPRSPFNRHEGRGVFLIR